MYCVLVSSLILLTYITVRSTRLQAVCGTRLDVNGSRGVEGFVWYAQADGIGETGRAHTGALLRLYHAGS